LLSQQYEVILKLEIDIGDPQFSFHKMISLVKQKITFT
jgi:hypothetical protein